MKLLVHHDREYHLRRFPLKKDDRLQAWDAADEYLLRWLDSGQTELPAGDVLLVNDSFGALGVALFDRTPVGWGDSFLGRQAWRYNLFENKLDAEAMVFVPADETPAGPFALALIKLPKSLAFFEDQLLRLRSALPPGAVVLTGGMIKHTPKRAYDLLAEIIGPTETTLGWKKARLAVSRLADRTTLAAGVPPVTYELPGTGLKLQNLPNVFSRVKLDAGTRLLLDNLPQTETGITAIDLGCGNGVLALALARACPRAQILGVDESYQAVASARLNAAQVDTSGERLSFRATDGLSEEATESRDLVVCNPPFHQGQTTGDMPAWTMFTEAARVLRPGGELRVVGNRHLGYHAKLRRLFGRIDLIASDERFVVLSAIKNSSRP